jgi:hypothetical protein
MTREQLHDQIGDYIELAATDITAAHRMIELYAQLALMLGKDIKELTAENIRLKQHLKNK